MPAMGRLPSLELIVPQNAIEVAAQLRISVIAGLGRNVLAVIAEVEDQEIVMWHELLPERQICVRCKSIAVGDGQARAIGIAVAPHPDRGAVLQLDIEDFARSAGTIQFIRPLSFDPDLPTRARMTGCTGSSRFNG